MAGLQIPRFGAIFAGVLIFVLGTVVVTQLRKIEAVDRMGIL